MSSFFQASTHASLHSYPGEGHRRWSRSQHASPLKTLLHCSLTSRCSPLRSKKSGWECSGLFGPTPVCPVRLIKRKILKMENETRCFSQLGVLLLSGSFSAFYYSNEHVFNYMSACSAKSQQHTYIISGKALKEMTSDYKVLSLNRHYLPLYHTGFTVNLYLT